MANRLQHLRGSEAEHSTFTGAKGEISLVTDTSSDRIPTGEVRVHDGTTAGGLPLTLGTTSKPLTNNIVLSSGVGINFNNYGSEDSNSATTVGSNLLDDYEEGTWATGLNDSSGNETAAKVTGYYTKVGNLCFCAFQSFNNINTTGLTSGDISCFKLPFTSTSRAGAHTIRTDSLNWPTGSGSITGTVEGNLFKLRRSAGGENDSPILVSSFTSGTTDVVDFSLIYTVS